LTLTPSQHWEEDLVNQRIQRQLPATIVRLENIVLNGCYCVACRVLVFPERFWRFTLSLANYTKVECNLCEEMKTVDLELNYEEVKRPS